MAISSGDVCTDSITEIQARTAGHSIYLTLENLCFIFKKKYELDDEEIRTDFQDMADWFPAQAWWSTDTMALTVNWSVQSILIDDPPEPHLPSTFWSTE